MFKVDHYLFFHLRQPKHIFLFVKKRNNGACFRLSLKVIRKHDNPSGSMRLRKDYQIDI